MTPDPDIDRFAPRPLDRSSHRPLRRFLLRQALRGLDALETGLNPLRRTLERDSHYRFRSLQEVKWGAQLGVRIDANRATVDDWLRLPGFSIHQARALVELSRSGTVFTGWEEVAAVTGLALEGLQPLGDIVQFYFYDPDSAIAPPPVSLNRASLEQLMTLPNIDIGLAQKILDQRRQGGPYRSWLELKRRLQLPPAVLSAWLRCARL